MKFRKSSASSPKMELLSRRSSSDRMSTLKRSRSFRASLKLMSKLRSHASLRLNGGFDLSPVAPKDQKAREQRSKLPLVEESSSPAAKADSNTILPDDPSRKSKEIVEELCKHSAPSSDHESRGISKDLKTKLCLTDRIMRRNRKDTEKSSKKDSQMSPKVGQIFRWKSNEECPPTSCGVKKDILYPDERVSYENPTFCLDSSLDSSVSSFLFESTDRGETEGSSLEDPCQDAGLTLVLDSRGPRQDDAEETSECSSGGLRALIPAGKVRSLSVNDAVLQDEEAGASLSVERAGNFDCQLRGGEGLASKGHKSPEIIRTTSVCSSKSCRIRTVDNIANFWTNARGSSFRSKVSVGRKKSIKDSRDHESIGQNRVLVTTTSGSSTGHQVFS